jgi:hypothetical protein
MNQTVSVIEQQIGYALAALFLALINFIAYWVMQKMKSSATFAGFQVNDAQKAEFEDAAKKAANYGAVMCMEMFKKNGWDHPDASSAAIAVAAPYLVRNFPDAIVNAGLDPTKLTTQDAVKGIITRVMPQVITELSASPATPPVAPGAGKPEIDQTKAIT